MSEDRSQQAQRLEQIRSWANGWVQGGQFPGALVSIFDDRGKSIFYHECTNDAIVRTAAANATATAVRTDLATAASTATAAEVQVVTNTAALENDGIFREDSIFRIYSMTKPITAVATLILLERGLISLEDPLHKYIPSFETATVLTGGTLEAPLTEPLKTPITILHLLTHTSGLCYGISPNDLCEKLLLRNLGVQHLFHIQDTMSLGEMCDRIAASPLLFQPGAHFTYGINLEVLGRVVEIVSGMQLDAFFEKEIFSPLGMRDTAFFVPKEKRVRLLPCYEATDSATFRMSPLSQLAPAATPVNLSGGGGLFSTLGDYAKFATCLLNEGAILSTDADSNADASNTNNGSSENDSSSSGSSSGGVDIIGSSSSAPQRRLLRAETVALMRRNHLPNGSTVDKLAMNSAFLEVAGGGYGFGLAVCSITDPLAVSGGALSSVQEFGWGGLASTYFFVDPVQRFTVIFLTQLIPSSKYPYRAQLKWLSHWAMQPN